MAQNLANVSESIDTIVRESVGNIVGKILASMLMTLSEAVFTNRVAVKLNVKMKLNWLTTLAAINQIPRL